MQSKNPEAIVKVNAYSGYKENQRPINFSIGNKTVEVIKIMEQWSEPEKDCFKIKAEDGKIYNLCWVREEDLWYVIEHD